MGGRLTVPHRYGWRRTSTGLWGGPQPWLRPAASFVPSDIAGLVAWYDASDTATITESGGAVSQWDDLSGGGHHLTQGTASAQPTTGTRTQNGLNVLDFATDKLVTSSSLGASTTWTAFVVAASDAASKPWQAIISDTGSGLWGVGPYSGAFHWYPGAGTGGSYSAGVPFVMTAANNANDTYIYVDGTQVLNVTASGCSLGNLGVGAYGTSSDALDGFVGEIVVYNSVLGSTDRATVETYLTSKWAV